MGDVKQSVPQMGVQVTIEEVRDKVAEMLKRPVTSPLEQMLIDLAAIVNFAISSVAMEKQQAAAILQAVKK